MPYTINQLKRNRSSLLMHGGTEAERRALALAAAQALSGEPFLEAKEPAQLMRALKGHRGTVYVPDVTVMPAALQREVVRVLREHEEHPRLVLGLSSSLDAAVAKGQVTDDLCYWLRTATVDLRKRNG